MVEERLERLEARVEDLSERIDARVGGLVREVSQLRNDMHVLHEDLVDRIKALAPDFAPIRREFQQADDKVKESLLRRIEPIEAAERARRRTKR